MAYLDDNGLLYLWNKIKALVTNAVANKVDKVSGKGLSTNDYTTVEKTKLAGIAANANNYVHPSTHAATMIVEDTTHRFITDVERDIWNAKVDKQAGKGLSTNDYTTAEKNKLAGLNNFTHPDTDGNKHVPATGTTNNGKALIAGSTAGTFSWQALTKSMVGLGSVDNTSDLNKPISTATQNALDGKFKFGWNRIEYDDLDTVTEYGIYITSSGVQNGPVSGHPLTVLVCIGNYKATQLCIDDNKFYIRSRGVLATTWDDWKPIEHFTAEEKTKLSGIAANANNYVHPNTAGNKHIPSGGKSRDYLKWSADGTAEWGHFRSSMGDSESDDIPPTTSAVKAYGTVLEGTMNTKVNGLRDEISKAYAKKADIVGMYKYKGSVADASKLPTTGQTTGDVYNIVAPSIYGAAGANVAWDGSKWDSLGEIFTITSITNAQIDTICA